MILGAMALASSTCAAVADFAPLLPAERLEQSSLIVNGTFLGGQEMRTEPDAPALHIGVIRVSQVIKGDPSTQTVLLRLPPPRPPGLAVSDDIMPRPGQTGTWYLRAAGQGQYVADHPSRFVPVEDTQPQR